MSSSCAHALSYPPSFEVVGAPVGRDDRRRAASSAPPEIGVRAQEQGALLLAGVLGVIDHFEASGRLVLIARARAGASLTRRESEVLELAARGYANKLIAYELHVTSHTVAEYIARAKAKLGVTSRIDIVFIFTAAKGERRAEDALWASTFAYAGEELVALSFPLVRSRALALLSPVELEVLESLLAGESNAAIGRTRHRSAHTVANQVASIFKKLRVGSRAELAACLARWP